MNISRDSTLTIVEKGLDALSRRQDVIAHNIANVETPHYKTARVDFESGLRRLLHRGENLELQRTDGNHLTGSGDLAQSLDAMEPTLFRRNNLAMRKDGNNVDIELEMVDLAETAQRFEALTTLASKKLALLRMVAQETR